MPKPATTIRPIPTRVIPAHVQPVILFTAAVATVLDAVEVVAVVKGRYEDGKHIPLSVEAGDTVMFQWGDKLVLDGMPETVGTDEVNYYLVRESEVLALIK